MRIENENENGAEDENSEDGKGTRVRVCRMFPMEDAFAWEHCTDDKGRRTLLLRFFLSLPQNTVNAKHPTRIKSLSEASSQATRRTAIHS